MQTLTESQKARVAIRSLKTITDALALRGFYRPSGRFGKSLSESLKILNPEIYGSMNDSKVVEIKGLEYIVDRLPKGVEKCERIILTEEGQFKETTFEKLEPLKRRRTAYKINDKEMCFVISRGLSELYDIITHITFLYIESKKVYTKMKDEHENITIEWGKLEKYINYSTAEKKKNLDSALWNLSLILGRPFSETKQTYNYFEINRKNHKSCNCFFTTIYEMGKRIKNEKESDKKDLVIYFSPSLINIIGQQHFGKKWAENIKNKICQLGFEKRPIHIISANLHSVVNTLYANKISQSKGFNSKEKNIYDFYYENQDEQKNIKEYAKKHGFYEIKDKSETHIDTQLIDLSKIDSKGVCPEIKTDLSCIEKTKPIILVMDYAFGAQASELMENLLAPYFFNENKIPKKFNFRSISIMGKAGILTGKKGDIMLATAHVFEGTSDNYIFNNDLTDKDFTESVDVYTGPLITVLGTSLQNQYVLKRLKASWKAIGLEMEGGHYQRAISSAKIKGYIPDNIKIRYAYYASDNPIKSGQTLAEAALGKEGIKPTYFITEAIIKKILEDPC